MYAVLSSVRAGLLTVQQLCVVSAARDQLRVTPGLHHRAVLQHADDVCIGHCAQAVRNDDASPAFWRLVQRLLDNLHKTNIVRRVSTSENNLYSIFG